VPSPPQPTAWIVAAIAREQTLVDSLTTAIAANAGLDARLRPALDDHAAHLTALRALPGAPVPSPASAASSPAAPSPAPSITALAAAETAAAQTAAGESARQNGSAAVLLASISACESTHAQWLS